MIAGSGIAAARSPSHANTAFASSSGSTTTCSPSSPSISAPAQPSHRILIRVSLPRYTERPSAIYTARAFALGRLEPMRRSVNDVELSRAETLEAAVQLASVVGLEGLTIGRLAGELEMSKSGLIGRFGSKQNLQLAALDEAAEIFRRTVYETAAVQPA